VRIWTTRRKYSGEFEEPLRWPAEDSPIPALLDHFCAKSLCEAVFFDIPVAAPKTQSSFFLDTACAVLSAATRIFKWPKTCRVLFYGNPALLGPVAEKLKVQGFAPMRRVRRITRVKELGLLFSLDWHLTRSHRPSAPEPFNEKLFYETFQKKGTFLVEGEDLLPVVWPKVRNFYRFQAGPLRRAYREVRALLERTKPGYLVVEEDAVEFGKMLTLGAKSLGIKSLVVQHGLPGDPLGFMPMQADHMAVWGETSRQVFERWGMEPSRIVVTGCPKYDSWESLGGGAKGARERLCRRFGWAAEKPIVLITPDILRGNAFERFEGVNPDAFEVLDIAKYFISIAKDVPGANFIYKFHGGSWDEPFYNKLAERLGGLPPNFKWMVGGVALDFMSGCDLLFNDVSSAGLEAVLLRRPLAGFNFSSQPDFYPLKAYGLEPVAHRLEEARDICLRLAEKTLPAERWIAEQEKLIQPYVFSRDGRSAERVANFIRKRSGAVLS